MGDWEPNKENHVEHQVPDKEGTNPSWFLHTRHIPILTGSSDAEVSASQHLISREQLPCRPPSSRSVMLPAPAS